jgi:hypothetical protein
MVVRRGREVASEGHGEHQGPMKDCRIQIRAKKT